MIWTTFDRILWGIVISLQVICALKYLTLAKENENFEEKLISLSYSFVFFGIVLNLIFILVGESLIPGTFVNHAFYGNYDRVDSTYKMIIKLANFFGFAGFTLFFYTFERIIKRTKYILTISWVIGLALLLILPYEFLRNNLFISFFSIFLYIFFLSVLLFYTKWSRLEFKAVSSLLLLGSLLIGLGSILISEPIKRQNIGPSLLILTALIYLVGTLMAISPTLIDTKVFTESLSKKNYWILSGIIVLGFMIIIEIYFIIYEFPIDILIQTSVAVSMGAFSIFYTLKSMKIQIAEEKNNKTMQFLEAFTKPKKVTEEEVSISKEKKICLVCKGKVARSNIFLCPECDTFYCSKCSEALSNLENACWVCETPFDESKPVRLPEKKEEEKIAVESKDQKKTKKK